MEVPQVNQLALRPGLEVDDSLRNAVGGLGSRLEENKGHTQIKKSPDMKQWEYVHD